MKHIHHRPELALPRLLLVCKEQEEQCRYSSTLGSRWPGVATALISPGKVASLSCQQSRAVEPRTRLAQSSLHRTVVAWEMRPQTPQPQVEAYSQIPAPAPPAKGMHVASSGSPCSVWPSQQSSSDIQRSGSSTASSSPGTAGTCWLDGQEVSCTVYV